MTAQDIRRRIAEIDVAKADFELAHSLEDKLYEDVLRFIASGKRPLMVMALAKEALRSKQIDFKRECA